MNRQLAWLAGWDGSLVAWLTGFLGSRDDQWIHHLR
jgi:hypothetical protein